MITLMKCGHAANATDTAGKPSCVICIGIVPGATEVDESPPSLEGRMAVCCGPKSLTPSDGSRSMWRSLPFFELATAQRCRTCLCVEYWHSDAGRADTSRYAPKACDKYVPAWIDTYYCGHAGWD